ncbi:MAG: nitroreductase family protein [Oscillospiraceae bacterium]|nr:nitroreductase family protein [Oscillospiraceae bacterium]
MTRRSVRTYLDKEIPDDVVKTILHAGMAGPSCTNARDWSFLVTRDPEILSKMADGNGGPAAPLRRARLGIMVLGDLERAFKPAPDYWIIDGAIAAQNMILAAHGLGVGSVWLGTYPQMERVNRQRELFGLPETVIPHSIIAFGYPDVEGENSPRSMPQGMERPEGAAPNMPPPPREPMKKGEYEESRIHLDRW